MASLSKAWGDGSGQSLSAVYGGSGNGTATFSSDVNEGADRSLGVSFKDISGKVTLSRTVRQYGRREPFAASDGIFVVADGGSFNVLKA